MMFNLFNKKLTVIFHMKSGRTIKVKCQEFAIKKNGNEIVGITLDGIDKRHGDPAFYIHLDSIEAITTER
jgi:hypothetical protein